MANENKALRDELYRICDETETRRSGMEYLVNYYKLLGWTEEESIKHAIGLFKNGTIRKIKLLNKDGEEI